MQKDVAAMGKGGESVKKTPFSYLHFLALTTHAMDFSAFLFTFLT
jgi:hypothetical protein